MSDITGATGMRVIRAIVAGERDAAILATSRDVRCHASAETVRQALVGNDREEHVFALTQALKLDDVYQAKVAACDEQIEAVPQRLKLAPRRQRRPCPPPGRRAVSPITVV